MAKPLVFKLNGNEYPFLPEKIDRRKLYGWTETVALDDDGNECKVVSMDESGTVIIPKGSMGLGMINDRMEWVDKSELIAVDDNGKEVEFYASSFSAPIELDKKVTNEEFLDHSIVSVYQLDEEGEFSELLKQVSESKESIFTFDFNYREGYDTQPAFLIESQGKLFILVGSRMDFEFVGLEQTGYIDEVGDEEEELSDEIGLDFSMM